MSYQSKPNFPYVGLHTYKITDKPIFYGRDEQIEEIVNIFLKNEKNFVAVSGQSGCGKSSLIRAGFLSSLQDGIIPGKVSWRIATFTPQYDPLYELAKALYSQVLTSAEQNQIFKKYKQNKEDIYEVIKYRFIDELSHIGTFLDDAGISGKNDLFVVIDQFEELLRTYQRAIQTDNIELLDECGIFVDILLATAEQSNIYIIVTMRSEFIGECINFEGLIEAVNDGLFLVPKMTRPQLKEAIIKPLEQFNDDIQDYLVQRILADSIKETHPLPVIQHALLQTWQYVRSTHAGNIKLTYNDYKAVGGLDGAINQHAEEIYSQLSDKQKLLCSKIFKCITERTTSKNYVVDARHPMTLANIAKITQATEQELVEVIEYFNNYTCGFITLIANKQNITSDTIIDISHESLISHWERLKEWVDEEAKNVEMYKQLRDDALKKDTFLWKGGKLKLAKEWLETNKPNEEWAKKYDTEAKDSLPTIERFIQKGLSKETKEKHTWVVTISSLTIIFIALVAALLVAKNTFQLYKQEQIYQAKTQINSHLTNTQLLTQKDNHSLAQQELANFETIDRQYISPAKQHTANLLNWFNSGLMFTPPIKTIQQSNAMYNLYSDSQWLFAGGAEGKLLIYDVQGKQQTFAFADKIASENKIITAITNYQDNILIAAYDGKQKQTIIYQLMMPITDKSELTPILSTDSSILAIASYKNTLAYADNSNTIFLWDLEDNQPINTLQGHQSLIYDLKFNPQGTMLTSSSRDKTIRLWNINDPQTFYTLVGHAGAVYKIAFNTQGTQLASSSQDKTIRLWDLENLSTYNTAQQVLQAHKAAVSDIAFSQDDKSLISTSHDNTLRLWDVVSGKVLRVYEGHQGRVNAVALAQDKIYSVSGDKTLREWESSGLSPVMQWHNVAEQPRAVTISPTGKYTAIGYKNGTVALYAMTDLTQPLWQSEQHTKSIAHLSFNQTGDLLASAGSDKTTKLWQVYDGKLLNTITHKDKVKSVSFSSNNQYLISASRDGNIGILSLENQQLNVYSTDSTRLNAALFAPQSLDFVTATEPEVKIWQWSEDNKPQVSQTITNIPNSIEWTTLSSDGQKLAIMGGNPTAIYIYETSNYDNPSAKLIGHIDTVAKAEFSPDNQQLITLGADNTIRFWDLTSNSELFTIQLPVQDKNSTWDFDFQCIADGQCWIAVPLKNRNAVIIYDLGNIYTAF
ncbi:AAA family ATPase [Candidatus Albibeggiatoa sp. nov. BB20]|uniref:nSTAND1 domain-containing NTPase n=1 Tax=Candidatus Albibeggiatoa sp. nov. BB20 TaxID=3162723 RepID=UPI00336561C8